VSQTTLEALFGFSGRIIIAQFLTYFFVGFFFYLSGFHVFVYYENNPNPLVTAFHRPSSSLLVQAGPLFQLIRGVIFAVALFPFRRVFLERKWGWVYLWGLFLALAIFAPAGESPGSIEGFVYTNLPVLFHLMYLPELIVQTLAFSWLVVAWEHHKVKELTIPLLVVFFAILIIMIIGVLIG
jgi:hypothetical protein